MRCLFLAVALAFGWFGAPRAEGQTVAETMTFSIICQYVTNTFTTNHSTGEVYQDQHLLTVVISSPNIVKAIAVDMFTNAWTNWSPAHLVYEQNMTNGHQGIYLRYNGKQTNVSAYFTNGFSTNGFANMFSHDATNAFAGAIFPGFSTNGYASVYTQDPTNIYNDTNFPANSLPLSGGLNFGSGTVGTAYDNLAYLTLSTRNISLSLFGYSQGTLVNTVYDKEGDAGKVDKSEIVGVGTFSLNLTTNFLFVATNTPGVVTTNVVPPTNYVGLAHGTIMVGGIYHLDFGPPEGP